MSKSPSSLPYLRRLFDGRILELEKGESIIGRSEECDLVLHDEPGLSRKHARITIEQDRIVLFDLGSLNGTLVNGTEALNKLTLHHGDIIVFDEFEYELLIPESAPQSGSSPSQKETKVANRREREDEDLIKSEVRIVDDQFMSRELTNDTKNEIDTENAVIASISQPTFIVRGMGTKGVRIPLNMRLGSWSIGSAIDQDVSIPHSSVGKSHASLSVSGGIWTMTILGNGDDLLINGQCFDRAIISSGDVIRVGEIDCLFVCPREFGNTLDTSDMTPVAWRDSRELLPRKTFNKRVTIVLALICIGAGASYYYWRFIS